MASGQFSLAELIQRCDAARERMSRHNPNRQLLADCTHALIDLAGRLSREMRQQAEPADDV